MERDVPIPMFDNFIQQLHTLQDHDEMLLLLIIGQAAIQLGFLVAAVWTVWRLDKKGVL